MAHTPGPWTARPDSGQIVLNGANIYAVKEICNEQGGFNPDDILLMASAPELLAELKACKRMLSEIVDGREHVARAWLAAGKVIDKAEGRA